jgi:hypothetical protein
MLRDAFAIDAAAVKHRFCNSFRGLSPMEFSTFSFRSLGSIPPVRLKGDREKLGATPPYHRMDLRFPSTSATAWAPVVGLELESWAESALTSFNSWTELALNHRQLRFSDVNSCAATIIGQERHTMKKQIVIGDLGPLPVASLFMRF